MKPVLAARGRRVGAVGTENDGCGSWRKHFSGNDDGEGGLSGRNHSKTAYERCKRGCPCGRGVSQNALIRVVMGVMHRARSTGRIRGTSAQFFADKQQRCSRHGADLTHEPGADDPGEMSPDGTHVASLAR